MTKRQQIRQLAAHYGYFFLAWLIIQVFYNVPIKNLTTGWQQELLTDAIKLIAWLGAGLTLVTIFRSQLAIQRPFRANWRFKPQYYWLIGIIVYLVFSAYMRHHSLGVVSSFKPEYLLQDFLIVGLCEETLFRGYFLNRLLKILENDRLANVIQAVLFALIHLPRYLTTYPTLTAATILTNLVTVFILGLLFGWLFMHSKSLWPGIMVHSVWDLLIVLLIG